MKKRTLLTPIDLAAATQTGKRTFLKQVLPLGSINYRGRKIVFDKAYLTDLAESFNDGAYDQVPVVAADPDNRHNMDPNRFGGEIQGFEVKDDGLYAKVSATKATARLLNDNPKLGVSARIVEGLEKSDGRKYRRAIQHVLLTMDPRVTGMKPWQTVDLSVYNGGDRRVVDLTALTIDKEIGMPKIKGRATEKPKSQTTPPTQTEGVLDLSELSDEDLDLLLSVAGGVDDETDEVDETDETDEAEVEEEDGEDDEESTDLSEEPTKVPAFIKSAQDEKERRTKGKKGKKAKKGTPPVLTNLSSPSRRVSTVDLAEDALGSDERDRVSDLEINLAEERWENHRREYARAGVPPFVLDLAAPLLSAPEETVVNLSSADEPVNATTIVRSVLDGLKGMIDLTPELGHAVDLSNDGEPQGESVKLLDAWDNDRY